MFRPLKFALLVAVVVLSASSAFAGLLETDLLYRGGPTTVCYTSVPPICVTNGIIWKMRNWNPQITLLGQTDIFDTTFDGTVNGLGPPFPISLDGTMTIHIPGRTDLWQPGAFPIEILQMNLTGGPGVMVRESPTQTSGGNVVITPEPGNNFRITSFFDIFTELSLDGGDTWAPSTGPSHFVLDPEVVVGAPEPASMLLTGGALLFVARKIRRRRAGA